LDKLLALLSPIQRGFVLDKDRFKVACAGRRGGKSYADAVYLIYECLKQKNTPTLYLGLTRESAKEIIWDTLTEILGNLGIAHEARPSGPYIRFPNGSRITLFGADIPNARNRLRGRKFKLVVVDEMGFFADADPLIYALLPALADYRGSLVMTSSPGEILSGMFYDAYEGKKKHEWRQYHWTLFDNPYFQRPAVDPKYKNAGEQEVEEIARIKFGGDKKHPAFIREYYGKYIADNTNLVYPYDRAKNLIPAQYAVPRELFGIGIDLGSVSENAIVVVKFSAYVREVQIVRTWKKANLLIDELADVLKGFIAEYDPAVIVADTGGYGKGVVEELRRRYFLPIKAADKQDKAFYQRIFANDLISGYIKVLEQEDAILGEWDKILRDETGEEIRGQPNHCFLPGQLVLTRNRGHVPIEQILVGDEVLTHMGRWRPVMKLWEREYSGDIQVVSAPAGEDIRCTPNHRFWTATSERSYNGDLTGQLRMAHPPRWIAAEDLSKDERHNLTVADIPITESKWTKEHCLMLGYWAAEGSISSASGQVNWAGHKNETRIIPLLERGLESHGYGQPSKTRSTPKKLGVYIDDTSQGRRLNYTCKSLVEFLAPLGKSTSKRLPYNICDLSAEKAIWALSGYIYGDGHFDKLSSVKSSSISRELAYQVALLARKCGILSSIRFQRRAGRWGGLGLTGKTLNDCWSVTFSKRDFLTAIADYPDLLELFKDKRNFDLPVSKQIVGRLQRKEQGHNLVTLLDVSTETYSGPVYNLMVEEDASYCVNNITVSNCSDAALYIYRQIYNTYLKTFKPAETDEEKMERQATEQLRDDREAREEEQEDVFDYM
jgi:hypothetical protein